MLLVVFSSLRCVRAQRRRARSGKDGATWHPVSTLLALRKKQLRYKLQQLLVRLLRMQVCRVQPLRWSNSSLQLQPCKTFAAASKAEPRLCETYLPVATDPVTPSIATARQPSRGSSSPRLSERHRAPARGFHAPWLCPIRSHSACSSSGGTAPASEPCPAQYPACPCCCTVC